MRKANNSGWRRKINVVTKNHGQSLDKFEQFAIDTREVRGGSVYIVIGRAKWYDEPGTAGITITDDGCMIPWIKLDSTGEMKYGEAMC